MYYKKFFSATALVTLLSLSHSAFSDPVGPISDEETSYYVRLQYNGEISLNNTKIEGVEVKAGDVVINHPFKSSFIAGSGAFGYKMDDIRVDVEGLYSRLDKNSAASITSATIADNLTAFSGLVNVHYDVVVEDMPITPYVGVGVGAAYFNNPVQNDANKNQKEFGFAYQAKAGVSYDVTPEIKLFAGARYFGAYCPGFDGQANNNGKVKILYSTIGAEAGVAFDF